jgi:hypothetical protein
VRTTTIAVLSIGLTVLMPSCSVFHGATDLLGLSRSEIEQIEAFFQEAPDGALIGNAELKAEYLDTVPDAVHLMVDHGLDREQIDGFVSGRTGYTMTCRNGFDWHAAPGGPHFCFQFDPSNRLVKVANRYYGSNWVYEVTHDDIEGLRRPENDQ